MIYATVNMTIGDYSSTCDNKILLYRGDKNVEIRIVMKGNKFTVLDSTYAQMIIKRPSATSVFSEPAPIQNDTVVFVITEDMIDELKEIGEYTFQVRLYDDTMTARATLPPCDSALIIERPIAVEGEAAVNLAMVNDSAVMLADTTISEGDIFTEDGKYNRTIWKDGDLITDAKLNKIEEALYYINENGGGSGATAPYISTELSENVMVGVGANFNLYLDFNSPNMGKGTLKVFINDVDSISAKIDQGETVTVIPGELFIKGTNQVTVYVLDRVGVMSNSLTFYVRYGSTELASDFDAYSAYDYGATVRYYFTPTALDTSLTLTFYMSIDGAVQQGVPCTSDTRGYYTFPSNLSADSHYCEAYVIDSNGTKSNVLTFNLIMLSTNTIVVASDTKSATIEEGSQLALDYKVYMKNNLSFITKTYVDNVLVNTGTCGLDFNYYRTSSLTEGTHTIKMEVWDTTETYSDYVTWTVTVTESTFEAIQPANAGAMFIATAVNKSNTDERRNELIGKDETGVEITGTLHNFAFNSESGWVDDELIISGNSHVEIPIQPLANNARYGFTLDLEFTSRQIGVEDAEVLTLWNEEKDCGIRITTESLILRSAEGNECNLYYSDNERTNVMFIIDRNERTAKIYLNGVMCEAFHLSDYSVDGVTYLEDFTVNSNLILGGYNKNGYSKIRNLRIYNIALTTDEIINNWISCEIDKGKQRELVEFQKGNELPTMYIYCDFSGLGKDDKKPCRIVYHSTDEVKYGKSFNLDHKQSTCQYQGTSSMAYPIKNYRINLADATGEKWKYDFPGGQPEHRFTLKADFMNSCHAHNTGMAKFINDNLYNYKMNDEKSMNPFKWNHVQNGGDINDFREAINGFPCRLILVNDGNTPLNEGQNEPTPGNTKDMGIFNFNNDKDATATLGFDSDIFPNCASYEVTANSDTSAGAFMSFGRVSGQWLENLFVTGATISYNATYSGLTAIKVNPGETYHIVRIGGTMLRVALCRELPYAGLVGSGRIASDATEYTLTIPDGYSYMAIYMGPQGKPEDIKVYNETSYSESDELEYIKQSFELRYPDSDDVSEDWGFMGVETELNKFDYYIQQETTICTTRIAKGYFGTDVITSPNLRDIVCYDGTGASSVVTATNGVGTLKDTAEYFRLRWNDITSTTFIINETEYHLGSVSDSTTIKDPYVEKSFNTSYSLKSLIDWVDNCTDEEFVSDFEEHFHKDYTLRYYALVVLIGAVDNLGKNMMLDTADNKIFFPRFYDIDTILSYDNSGAIKFNVDIEMEQGYWNTSSSRLWTRIRELMHNDVVAIYNDMRQNGVSYENIMRYMYDEQISKIPQTYYNKDYDVKYAPFADSYMGMAHGNGYEHMKRWLKNRFIFCDTLFDYAPSYNNDMLTIRVNTTEPIEFEIETYTPVYQHLSWYNGQMDKKKIDGKTSVSFTGTVQAATDQEVLIYGGSNVKSIKGIQSGNPNRLILGSATKLVELDAHDCPLLSEINMNKANLAPHEYLTKVNLRNCPLLGGNLILNNSPLIQEVDIRGTDITGLNLPSSIRNLETLRLPNGIQNLTLNDAGMLHTLECDEGIALNSINMTNCNALENVIGLDLLQTPSITLNNSFNNVAELYFRDTTNLSLSNMSNLERVIFTPNNEYETFELINVANAPDYKVTTFNCPKLSTFMTTAPYRDSYNNGEYGDIQPNTTFTANSIDISSTQFTDVKLLCTTDTNTLKLPTTVKNFYCDSSFDLDTDWLEDGEYDVVHDELIEQYTTDYEGEVHLFNELVIDLIPSQGVPGEGLINNERLSTQYAIETHNSWARTDYIACSPNSPVDVITVGDMGGSLRLAFYDSNKTRIEGVELNGTSNRTAISPTNASYVIISLRKDLANAIGSKAIINSAFIPNIIPSSADGSLIFSMYAPNNTVAPASGTWDLYGLEFDNFHTYGVNNDVKYNSVKKIVKTLGLSDLTWEIGYNIDSNNNLAIQAQAQSCNEYIEVLGGSNFITNGELYGYVQYDKDKNIIQRNNYTGIGTYTLLDSTVYIRFILYQATKDTFSITYTTIVYGELDGDSEIISVTMPARYDDYNITIKNADISPTTHNTMLYPLLVNEDNPITGTLDYTNYAGKYLSWSFAYTDLDKVDIIQPREDLLNSYEYTYNAFYDTEFEFDNPNEVARYTCNASGVFPTFNSGFTYTYDEIDNNDGTYTTKIYADSLDNLPTSISFQGKTALLSVEKLNTSKVTAMNSMFSDCTNLTSLNLNGFDTSNVTVMSNMFNGCSNLPSLDVSGFNTGKVTNMTNMFNNCSNLTSLDLSSFNTSKVTKMDGMFTNCNNLSSIDLSSFNTSKVTTMRGMFQGCSLTSLDLSEWDTSQVEDMSGMFHSCRALHTLILPNIVPTSPFSLQRTFQSCVLLNNITWTSKVVKASNLNYTFYECVSLTSLDLSNWDTSEVTNTSIMFNGCSNLASLDVSNWDTSQVTNMSAMFQDCTVLTEIKGIEGFNTENVNKMNTVFKNCTSLTSLNLSGWKTDNVGDMAELFYNCNMLTEIIGLENWNTDNVTAMSSIFNQCRSLRNLKGIENWNVEKVGSLYWTFRYCEKITSLDLSNWNTTALTNIGYAFMYCTSLKELDLSNWNVDNVTLYTSCFSGSNALDIVNLSGWTKDKVELVITTLPTKTGTVKGSVVINESLLPSGWVYDNALEVAKYTCNASGVLPILNSGFTYTYDEKDNGDGTYTTKIHADSLDNLPSQILFSGITQLLSVEKLNTSKVTNMKLMFRDCTGLTSINVSKYDTSNVTDISNMFYYCTNLESIIGFNSWNTSKVTDISNMFYLCGKLTSLDVSGFDTGNVTNMANMFQGCTSLTSLDLSEFDTKNVTAMQYMFYNCKQLTSLDISNWDTSQVINMSNMFYLCGQLTSLDLSGFDTGTVTNMANMFNGCTSLTSLDLSEFDTKNVTNMSSMFQNCKQLTSLDISNWDTSQVIHMSYVFANCNALTEIIGLNTWDTGNVINMEQTFAACKILESLDLSSWDISKVTNMTWIFNECYQLTSLNSMKNISRSLELSSTKLNTESILDVIDNLATVTTTRTLTLGSTLLTKITGDQIAIATNKGWTVV